MLDLAESSARSDSTSNDSEDESEDDKWELEFEMDLITGDFPQTPAVAEITSVEIRDMLQRFMKRVGRLSMKESVIEFWNTHEDHSQLFELATNLLAVPGTQVSVERLFSSLKFVVNDYRLSLSDRNIADIMLIKCNRKILYA